MSSVVQIMQIMFYGVATLFMICFMIIGIWAFVLYIKMFKNNRVRNYLLQKINDTISSFNMTNNYSDLDGSLKIPSTVIEDSVHASSENEDSNNTDSIYKIK